MASLSTTRISSRGHFARRSGGSRSCSHLSATAWRLSASRAKNRFALFHRRAGRTRRDAVDVTRRKVLSRELSGHVVSVLIGRIRQSQNRLAARVVARGSRKGRRSGREKQSSCANDGNSGTSHKTLRSSCGRRPDARTARGPRQRGDCSQPADRGVNEQQPFLCSAVAGGGYREALPECCHKVDVLVEPRGRDVLLCPDTRQDAWTPRFLD